MAKIITCILFHAITILGYEGVLALEKVHICSKINKNKVPSDFGTDKSLSCKKGELIFVETETYSLQQSDKKCDPSIWSANCQYVSKGGNYFLGIGDTCNGRTDCTNLLLNRTLVSWFNYMLASARTLFNQCTIDESSTIITVLIEYECIEEDIWINMCHDFKDSFPNLNHLSLGREMHLFPIQCSCTITGSKMTLTALQIYSKELEDVSINLDGRNKNCTLNPTYLYNKDISCSIRNLKTVNISVTARRRTDKFWIRIESEKRPNIECRAVELEEITGEMRNMATFPETQTIYPPQTNTSANSLEGWYLKFGIFTAFLTVGVFLTLVMVAGVMYGLCHVCRCYKRYMKLNIKRLDVPNIYAAIRQSRLTNRSSEMTTKHMYDNCKASSSNKQSDVLFYDNCTASSSNEQSESLFYDNCTASSSNSQPESLLYDNCRNPEDVVIVDTRHSYAEILDTGPRNPQITGKHSYVNT